MVDKWNHALTGAVFAAVTFLAGAPVLLGSPGDIANASAPQPIGSTPEAIRFNSGDSNVATRTGAFTYSMPIIVPPGRGSATPNLSLSYSSHGSNYGDIAAGWSLDIPSIDFDPQQPENESIVTRGGERRYVSGLAGGQLLLRAPESPLTPNDVEIAADVVDAYRAVRDPNIRYERLKETASAAWRARRLDGSVYLFGEGSRILDAEGSPIVSAGITLLGSAPLTTYRDIHGNEIHYYYETHVQGDVVRDFHISLIEYSHHDSIPGHFAEVHFSGRVANCRGREIGVGAQVVAKGLQNVRFKGQRMLLQIETRVVDSSRFRSARTYTLAYDQPALSCNNDHAPIRLLSSVKESTLTEEGFATMMAPVEFEYNALSADEVTLDVRDFDLRNVQNHQPTYGFAGGERGRGFWTTVHSMMLDYDGDGLQDRLTLDRHDPDDNNPTCTFRVQRSNGRGFDEPQPPMNELGFPLPVPPAWRAAADDPYSGVKIECSLTGVLARNLQNKPPGPLLCGGNRGTRLNYHFLDMNGNGVLELVTSITYDPLFYDPVLDEEELGFSMPSCPSEPPPLCIEGRNPCGSARDAVPCMQLIKKQDEDDWDDLCQTTEEAVAGRDEDAPMGRCLFCQDESEFMCDANPPPGIDLGDLGGNYGQDPNGPACTRRYRALEVCNEWFVWVIYERGSNGWALGNPVEIMAPFPADPDVSGVVINPASLGWNSGSFAIQDVNGDKIPDALISKSEYFFSGDRSMWTAFFGEWDRDLNTFEFKANTFACSRDDSISADIGFEWEAPNVALKISIISESPARPPAEMQPLDARYARTTNDLIDVNGDGLPDLVATRYDEDEPYLAVYYNHGDRFGDEAFELFNSNTSPGAFSSETILVGFPGKTMKFDQNGILVEARKLSNFQFRDVDQDGLGDWINLGEEILGPQFEGKFRPHLGVHFNLGGAGTLTVRDGREAFAKHIVDEISMWDSEESDPAVGHKWTTNRLSMDLDGDGYPEILERTALADTPSLGVWKVHRRLPRDTQPLRLMKTVHNGRGLRMNVAYGPIRPSGEVNAVVSPGSAASGLPTLNNLESVSTNQWVVSALSTNNGDHLEPSIETTYQYVGPQFRRADGQTRFRGFESVRTMSPAGAITVEQYGYNIDPTGRLERVVVKPGPVDLVHRITETEWSRQSLTGGASYIFPEIRRTWICSSGQDEAACTAETPLVETQFVETTVTNGFEIARITGESESVGHDPSASGSRRFTRDFLFLADAGHYVLRTVKEWTYEIVDGVETLTALTRTDYDEDGRNVTASHAHFDESNAASTTYDDYDLTGNLIQMTKPNGSGSVETQFGAFNLFPSVSIRHADGQPSLRTEFETDFGTGEVTETRGPNAKNGVPFTTVTEIDGFGRPLARWTSVDTESGYKLVQTTESTYDDASNTITNKRLIEFDETRWAETVTRFDGFGRAISLAFKTDSASAIERFEYDKHGNLERYTAPDPSVAAGASVEIKYRYDSLGRLTGIVRPATSEIGQTTLVTEYDGMTTTVWECPSTGSACDAATPDSTWKSTKTDHFGRLVKVIEATEAGPALTRYLFKGNTKILVDTNLNETVLVHDWLGRRTEVHRAGRTYFYEYDDNGNMTREIAPNDGANPDLYTIISEYDGHDRLESHTVPARSLQPDSLAELGIGETTFNYNTGDNGLGRLTRVEYPNGDWVEYRYDSRGNVIEETRSIPGDPFASMSLRQTYNALGKLRTITHPDDVGSSGNSTFRYYYDIRGLPESVAWIDENQETLLVRYDRNLAGLVTDRFSGNGRRQGEWSYDSLGRVLEMTVQDPRGGIVARQTLAYEPFGDTARLSQTLGTVTRDLEYRFDQRHQIIEATESIAGGFRGQYSYDLAGRLRHATMQAGANAPALLQARERHVEYNYSGPTGGGGITDPQAVDELRNLSDGSLRARYLYDASGNVIRREEPTEGEHSMDEPTSPNEVVGDAWILTYDGADLQRQVKHGDRTETYFYDHTGQRYLAIETNGEDELVRKRLFFGPTEIHLAADGNVEKTLSTIRMGQSIARLETDSQNRRTSFLYHSTLQHLVAALDDQGTLLAGFFYGPFGEILGEVGEAGSYPRRFNDKYLDGISALNYYGFRYYDNLSLTWTQADPKYQYAPDLALDDPRRQNLYTFSLNNPLRFFDPDGREPIDGSSASRLKSTLSKVVFAARVVFEVVLGSVGPIAPPELPTPYLDPETAPRNSPPDEKYRGAHARNRPNVEPSLGTGPGDSLRRRLGLPPRKASPSFAPMIEVPVPPGHADTAKGNRHFVKNPSHRNKPASSARSASGSSTSAGVKAVGLLDALSELISFIGVSKRAVENDRDFEEQLDVEYDEWRSIPHEQIHDLWKPLHELSRPIIRQ